MILMLSAIIYYCCMSHTTVLAMVLVAVLLLHAVLFGCLFALSLPYVVSCPITVLFVFTAL